MKKDKVLSTEKNKPIEVGAKNQYFIALYTGEVAGIKTDYGYFFLDDVLVLGGYVFKEKHSNKNEYIDDYSKLKEILTRKYGSPIKPDSRWYNDLYKNSPQDYGLAVSIGHLGFQSEWETDRTFIRLTLIGDNYKLILNLHYKSKLHKELIDKAEEKLQEHGL